MSFILGLKKNMSQVFDEDGSVIPVTLIEAGPAIITQIKTKEKDGYDAVQVGFGQKSDRQLNKPQKGHFSAATKAMADKKGFGNFKYLKEFRINTNDENIYKVGDKITADVFKEGDDVEVAGTSKGKGFQGVVKRHGFHGGPRTHGQKHSEREGGSIGATGPQKVSKGKKMPGKMGGDRVRLKGLRIVKVEKDKNILAISGAVPGSRGTLLEIVSN